MDEESKSTFGENPFQIVLKKEDFPAFRTDDVLSEIENEIQEGINEAQKHLAERWAEDRLSKNKSLFEPFGELYGHGVQFDPSDNLTSRLTSAVRELSEQQSRLMMFPERNGPELHFGTDPATGASSVIGTFHAAQPGIMDRIRELHKKMEGGVEPPSIVTAKDMADELEALPRSFVEVALDPLDTGEADKFLEELKEQGEGFAVTLTREQEFDDLNLMDLMQKEKDWGVKFVNPRPNNLYDAYSDFMLKTEQNLMFKDPGAGIVMDVDQIPRMFLGGGLIP